jgi:predicted secreted hydrolase
VADFAVPFHGNDGFKHFLVSLNLIMNSSSVGHSRLRVVSLCLALLSIGCDTETSQLSDSPGPEQGPGQPPGQPSQIDWRSMFESLAGVDTTLPSVVLPADLRSHPENTGESFEARWSLKSESGQSYSAFSQLDRLKLTEASNSESSWSYNSVARANMATGDGDSSVLDVREIFSRVALGLSDSRGDEFLVGNSLLSLGQSNSCQRTIQFSHRDSPASGIALSAESNRCPQSVSLGTVNQWEFEGIPARGSIASNKVEGFLWLTHRWGSSVNVQSAIVLDQLRIVVWNDEGKPQWLSITRSKRRSGRGPKTILGIITDVHGDKRDAKIEWFDNGEVLSPMTGIIYPETVRIQELSMGLDILLSPVVRLSEIRDSLQTRWSGALDISGSHTGFAYLDFLPVVQKETE